LNAGSFGHLPWCFPSPSSITTRRKVPVSRRFRLAALSLVAAAGLAVSTAVAAAPTGTSTRSAKPARLAVGVEVLRFSTAGRSLRATGLVTAKLTDNSGHTNTVRTAVALAASAGGGCRVLHLDLKELTLNLLGLHAHLDRVVLDITGKANGGVLGSLFCKLARAKIASVRVADAHALTAAVRRHRGHVLRFKAFINPALTSQATTATCPVLDLVVGPLNLQLLGLVVNLNRVHLTVTATRGEGALGDLFCQLADNSTTTTTTPTTTG
jgi:hypothetical protein